jgi:heme-degrading monooxygenase HmoA
MVFFNNFGPKNDIEELENMFEAVMKVVEYVKGFILIY